MSTVKPTSEDAPGIGTALLIGAGAVFGVGTAMYLVGHAHGEKYVNLLRPPPPKPAPPDPRPVNAFSVMWVDRDGAKSGKVKIRYDKRNGKKVIDLLQTHTPDKWSRGAVENMLGRIGAEFTDHNDGRKGWEGVYSDCEGSDKGWICKKSKSFRTIDGDKFDVWFYEEDRPAIEKVFDTYSDFAKKGRYPLNLIDELIAAGGEINRSVF